MSFVPGNISSDFLHSIDVQAWASIVMHGFSPPSQLRDDYESRQAAEQYSTPFILPSRFQATQGSRHFIVDYLTYPAHVCMY